MMMFWIVSVLLGILILYIENLERLKRNEIVENPLYLVFDRK